MAMNMKLIVVFLMLVNIAWDVFLDILDQRALKNKLPECVADVYDKEEYLKWRAYKSENKRMGVIGSSAGYAVSMALILTDSYSGFAGLFPDNIYVRLFSIVLLTTVVSAAVSLPFSLYSTFVIEEKYGFNRTTKKTFVLDNVKDVLLSLALETVLLSAFAAIHRSAGNWFIPVITVFFVGISLLMSLLSPALTRIFNKFRPLEEGELKDRLMKLLTNHGYRVRAVEVMDASRRSTRMNAYFTGIGPTKTIVLYDTMTDVMTQDQICAVFAHEMGHGIHHDIIRTRIFSVIRILVLSFTAWFVVSQPEMFADFGFNGINYGFAFMLVAQFMSIISPFMTLLTAHFSRRAEYRADAAAVDEGYGEALVSALKLIAKKNLSNLSPDPLLVKLTYSHPALAQRIEAIEKRLYIS